MDKSSKKEPRKRLEALLLALKIVYFSTATIYKRLAAGQVLRPDLTEGQRAGRTSGLFLPPIVYHDFDQLSSGERRKK